MISAIVWIGLSLLIMFFSHRLGLEEFRNPGPGLLPFLIGAALFLVSLYLLGSLYVKKAFLDERIQGKTHQVDLKRIFLVLLALLSYASLLETLGYLITSCLILVLLFRSMGSRWGIVLLSSVLTVVATYLLFTKLGVLLPEGILRF